MKTVETYKGTKTVRSSQERRMMSKGFKPLSQSERYSYAGADENALIYSASDYYVAIFSEGEVQLIFGYETSDDKCSDAFVQIKYPTLVDFNTLQEVIDGCLEEMVGEETLEEIQKELNKELKDNFGLELQNM